MRVSECGVWGAGKNPERGGGKVVEDAAKAEAHPRWDFRRLERGPKFCEVRASIGARNEALKFRTTGSAEHMRGEKVVGRAIDSRKLRVGEVGGGRVDAGEQSCINGRRRGAIGRSGDTEKNMATPKLFPMSISAFYRRENARSGGTSE